MNFSGNSTSSPLTASGNLSYSCSYNELKTYARCVSFQERIKRRKELLEEKELAEKQQKYDAAGLERFRNKAWYYKPSFDVDQSYKNIFSCIKCCPHSRGSTIPMYDIKRDILDGKQLNILNRFLSRIEKANVKAQVKPRFEIVRDSLLVKAFSNFINALRFIFYRPVQNLAEMYHYYFLLPKYVNRLVVSEVELEQLKAIHKYNVPIIYLPTYTCPVDYFVLCSALHYTGMPQPSVLLQPDQKSVFPLLQYLLGFKVTKLSAFDSDTIAEHLKGQRSVIIDLDAHNDNNSVINTIITLYGENAPSDVFLVPVNVIYDGLLMTDPLKVVCNDGPLYYQFAPKLPANPGPRLGRVAFNQPFSLKELMSSSFTKRHPQHVVQEHIIYDRFISQPLMPTHVLSFILYHKFGTGTSKEDLVKCFKNICATLRNKNLTLSFCGKYEDVVDSAINVLGSKLVTYDEQSDRVIPKLEESGAHMLSYYSTSILNNYVIDAIVMTSVMVCFRTADLPCADQVSHTKILDMAEFQYSLLKYEFVLSKPCEGVNILNEAIIRLVEEETLYIPPSNLTEEEEWACRFARKFEEDNDYYTSDDEYDSDLSGTGSAPQHYTSTNDTRGYLLNASEEVNAEFEFYHGLLRPYLEIYDIAMGYLKTLSTIKESEYLELMLDTLNNPVQGGSPKKKHTSPAFLKNTLSAFNDLDAIAFFDDSNEHFIDVYDSMSILAQKLNNILSC